MKKLKNIVKKNINIYIYIRNMYIKSKKEVHRETGRGKGEDIYHTSEIDKNNMYDVYEGTRQKGYFPVS